MHQLDKYFKFVAFLTSVLVLANWLTVFQTGKLNRNNIEFVRFAVGRGSVSIEEVSKILTTNASLSQDRCRNLWFTSLFHDWQDQHEQRNEIWDHIFSSSCPVQYMRLVKAKAPTDLRYALLSVTWYPEDADSWFWVGDIYYGTFVDVHIEIPGDLVNNELAVQYYQWGLQIEPGDSLHWTLLGHAMRRSRKDITEALDAYKQACFHNSEQGCFYSGKYSEIIGDISEARQYYLLSGTQKAIQALEELEKEYP